MTKELDVKRSWLDALQAQFIAKAQQSVSLGFEV